MDGCGTPTRSRIRRCVWVPEASGSSMLNSRVVKARSTQMLSCNLCVGCQSSMMLRITQTLVKRSRGNTLVRRSRGNTLVKRSRGSDAGPTAGLCPRLDHAGQANSPGSLLSPDQPCQRPCQHGEDRPLAWRNSARLYRQVRRAEERWLRARIARRGQTFPRWLPKHCLSSRARGRQGLADRRCLSAVRSPG
jgi:hypothetical protein